MSELRFADHRPCILLTEETWGGTLHAARSLHSRGVPVLIATAGRGAAIFGRSRSCTAAADFDLDGEALCRALIDWASSELDPTSRVVILPTSDRLLQLLSRHRDLFGERFPLAVPPAALVEALIDKTTSLQLAEKAGLDVPPWTTVRSEADIQTVHRLRLPVIVRPTSWSTAGDTYFKLKVAFTAAELEGVVTGALQRGATLLVQEYLSGREDRVEFGILWRSEDGSEPVVCTGRKVRQSSPEGGVMAWGIAEDLPDVREDAIRFLEGIGFTGLGGIEFIREGGRLRFVEFNPRLEAIHFLATRAGLDTVTLAYEESAYGSSSRRPFTQTAAAAWIGSAWLERVKNDRRSWWTLIRDRIRFARHASKVKAAWTWHDPGPGLAITLRLLRRGLLRRGKEDAIS